MVTIIYILVCIYLSNYLGLPQWLSDKELVSGAGASGDLGSVPGLERSPGGGHRNTLQDSCLEKTMDRGAWQARVSKSQTQLKCLSTHTCTSSCLINISSPYRVSSLRAWARYVLLRIVLPMPSKVPGTNFELFQSVVSYAKDPFKNQL